MVEIDACSRCSGSMIVDTSKRDNSRTEGEKWVRRNFPDELKANAIRLVVEQRYSFAQASEAMGVGDTALRRWVAQWRAEKTVPPRTVDQIRADAQRIRELEARVADLERGREILKKSTAFFMK